MDAVPSGTGQGERQEPAGQRLCCEGARWAGAPGAMQMGVRQRPRRPEGPRRGLPAGAEDTEAALFLPPPSAGAAAMPVGTARPPCPRAQLR